MGLYTYLIDIDSSTGQKRVISRAEEVGVVGQSNRIKTRGGITEVALGFAANMDDKDLYRWKSWSSHREL
jgi:hypothetical protein